MYIDKSGQQESNHHCELFSEVKEKHCCIKWVKAVGVACERSVSVEFLHSEKPISVFWDARTPSVSVRRLRAVRQKKTTKEALALLQSHASRTEIRSRERES